MIVFAVAVLLADGVILGMVLEGRRHDRRQTAGRLNLIDALIADARELRRLGDGIGGWVPSTWTQP